MYAPSPCARALCTLWQRTLTPLFQARLLNLFLYGSQTREIPHFACVCSLRRERISRARRREHLVVPLFANVENASVQPRRSRARTATGDRRYDRNHWRARGARGRQTGLTTFAAELLASTKTGLFAQRCSALVRSHVLDFYSAKAQHNSPPEQRGVGRSMQFARVALTNVCTNSIVYDAMLGTKNSCYDDHYLRFAISHNRTGSAGRQW